MPKILSFDLIGTLVKPSFVDGFWFRVIPSRLAKLRGLSFEESLRIVRREYEEVGEKRIEWYLPEYWVERLSLNCSVEELLEEAARQEGDPFYQDAKELLLRLKNEGWRVIIATGAPTNMAETVLKPLGSFDIFSSVSHLSLIRKYPRFYRALLKAFSLEPEEVLHIGDDPLYDYRNPRRVGMVSYLLDRDGQHRVTRRIGDLREVARLLV